MLTFYRLPIVVFLKIIPLLLVQVHLNELWYCLISIIYVPRFSRVSQKNPEENLRVQLIYRWVLCWCIDSILFCCLADKYHGIIGWTCSFMEAATGLSNGEEEEGAGPRDAILGPKPRCIAQVILQDWGQWPCLRPSRCGP
nr:uncharacterized protein LOC127308751 [Lolium perenne]